MPYTNDLALALALAEIADEISMNRFQSLDLKVESKPDLTPVSDADKSVESALRARIEKERPLDSVIGEEYGSSGGSSSRSCVLDPIDGTANYVRGVPVWCTLIALMEDNEPVVGVVSAPALNRRWFAAKGSGAFSTFGTEAARKISVSNVANLHDASLSYSGLDGFENHGISAQFHQLAKKFWRTRAYGDFWSHMLVAEGAVEVAIEPELSLWDMAALDIVVREAGGRFTNTSGVPGPHGNSGVSTNSILHNEVIRSLQ